MNVPHEEQRDAGGKWVGIAAAWLLGALLIAAGIAKGRDPASFAVDISHYRLVPRLLGAALSVYIPWLEIFTGAGLFLARTRRAARAVAFLMLAIFSVALLLTLARGIDLSCGCFGGGASIGAGLALLRNLVLLGILALSLRADAEPAPAQ